MEMEAHLSEIERVLSEAEAQGFYGLVLLRVKGQTLLSRGYGWADREAKRRMTMETGIEIGSIVKPLTLAALLRLAEGDRLSLDDTLPRHFSDVPEDKREITLEMITRHEAGLPDIFGGDYQLVSREWLVNKVLNCQLIDKPGVRNHYSNCGYSLLAALIEMVSGMPYEAFVRQEVLKPAGALRIGYRLAGWKNEQLAAGYRKSGLRWGTPLERRWMKDGPGWNLRGNGGMLAAAADLSRWYEGLWQGKVLGKKALDKFMEIDARDSEEIGGKVLGHAGGNGIFNCIQICYFARELYLTLFSSVADRKAVDQYRKFRESLIRLAKGKSIIA